MPVVNEHQPFDSHTSNRYSVRNLKSHRKSEVSTPELFWQVPDIFLCIESLGASFARDSAPYDRSYAESSFDIVSYPDG